MLWQMIYSISKDYRQYNLYIYSSEIENDSDILKRTKVKLNIISGKISNRSKSQNKFYSDWKFISSKTIK